MQDGLEAVFIQSVYCGWRKNEQRKRISEPDRGEKIACSCVDVIGESSDAFLPGSSGHRGVSVSSIRHSLSAARNFSCSSSSSPQFFSFLLCLNSARGKYKRSLSRVGGFTFSARWGVCAMCLCVCMCFFPTILQRAVSFNLNLFACCGPVSAGHLLMPAQLHPVLSLARKAQTQN